MNYADVPLLFKLLFVHVVIFSVYILELLCVPLYSQLLGGALQANAGNFGPVLGSESAGPLPCLCYTTVGGNGTATGRPFGNHVFPFLKKLRLLNLDKLYLSPHLLSREQPTATFVTAASSPFYESVLATVRSVQEQFPYQRIVVYDLGLGQKQAAYIDSLCNVERKLFPFNEYPPFFRDLKQFRWKPIIIAEALVEYGIVWYMDSSVSFMSANLSSIYRQFLPWADETTKRSRKYSLLLHSFTGHSIYSSTHPDVYKYFPVDTDELVSRNVPMYEASLLLAFRTRETVEQIMLWFVACALEADCMAPTDANTFCRFADERRSKYAHCHRYDQSVVNVLLADRLRYDIGRYTSGVGDFFRVQRFQNAQTNPPFEC